MSIFRISRFLSVFPISATSKHIWSTTHTSSHRPSPRPPQPLSADADLHGDDFGLDLTELSGITGFLMNEVPDNLGHFYPPWANDPAPPVKDEPMMPEPTAAARPQQQVQIPSPEPLPVAPVADPALDVVMGGTAASSTTATRLPPKPAKAASSAGIIAGGGGGVGATFRKTAAGGVTRRRSSSKEEQAKKRRERNRVLARRTRLRKKFFFQSLQQQVRPFSLWASG